MADDIQLVFNGTRIEAMYLKELLAENGIGSILKNTLESSFNAGWADGFPANVSLLYTETENVEKAKAFIATYLKSREESV
ncbi:MAG: hypothetical protein L3J66_05360 [Bacteroidales bacterium]|nr:hypothetical protein [Bacteroidales bacterium]